MFIILVCFFLGRNIGVWVKVSFVSRKDHPYSHLSSHTPIPQNAGHSQHARSTNVTRTALVGSLWSFSLRQEPRRPENPAVLDHAEETGNQRRGERRGCWKGLGRGGQL